LNKKVYIIAGVDEAGRGPLAGPVVAAAVILADDSPIQGLADSKTLSAIRREELSQEIVLHAADWAIGSASVAEIDRINILQASLLAMKRAVMALKISPSMVLIDGNKNPQLPYAVTCIVRGDQLVPAISAASIMAKVTRDRWMLELDQKYPNYGFARHKGYPTKAHIDALNSHGISNIHRRSFGPVKKLLQKLP
jgi:ribonuclease HII